jgi:hypothetical protein
MRRMKELEDVKRRRWKNWKFDGSKERRNVGNRERSQETIAGEHFACNCYSERETSKEYNYYIHRRLQRLDTVLESIFGRSRWLEHIRN